MTIGPIEKGANDGQTTYANDLVRCLRAGLSTRPRAGTSGSRVKKGRKRKSEGDDLKTASASTASNSASKPSDWGLFEPVHGILGPITDILGPLLTKESLIGFLVFLLIISWFRNSRLRAPSSGVGSYSTGLTPQRMAAYEEMWRSEESALWDWLEERVGMSEGGGMAFPANARVGNADGSRRARAQRKDVLRGRVGNGKVGGGKAMGEREVEWAIGRTEEKLRVLKAVVEKAVEVGIEEGVGDDGAAVQGEEKGRNVGDEDHAEL